MSKPKRLKVEAEVKGCEYTIRTVYADSGHVKSVIHLKADSPQSARLECEGALRAVSEQMNRNAQKTQP